MKPGIYYLTAAEARKLGAKKAGRYYVTREEWKKIPQKPSRRVAQRRMPKRKQKRGVSEIYIPRSW